MLNQPLTLSRQELQELGATCTVVISAPQTIEWSPPHAVRFGGLGLTSKLGLRIFVGIGLSSSPEVELGSVRYYRPETEEFESLAPDRHIRLEKQLRAALEIKEYKAKGFNKPASIHVLSEFPFYRGLNADAALATALAAALHIFHGHVRPEELKALLKKDTRALGADEDYRSIFKLAWSLEWATTGYRPEGHHIFSLLVQSPHPVVFWRQSNDSLSRSEDPFKLLEPQGYRLSELVSEEQIQRERVAGGKSPLAQTQKTVEPGASSGDGEALRAILHDPMSSLDAALIFLGREADSLEVILNFRENVGRRRDKRYESAMAWLYPFVKEMQNRSERPRFALLGPAGDGQQPSDSVMDLLVVHSVETFHAFCQLVQGGTSSDLLRDVVLQVDRAQDLYRLFGLSSGFVDGPIHVLRARARRMLRQKVGVRLMGPGRGGCLLIVAARGSLRFALPTLLEKVQKVVNPHADNTIHCHWFSEKDGYSPEGQALRVEQHEGSGIYITQAKRPMLVLRTWEAGEQKPERLIAPETWKATRGQYGMVFDATVKPSGEILLGGNKVKLGKTPLGVQAYRLLEVLLALAHQTGGDVDSKDFYTMWRQLRPNAKPRYSASEIESKIIKHIAEALKGVFECGLSMTDGKKSVRPGPKDQASFIVCGRDEAKLSEDGHLGDRGPRVHEQAAAEVKS